MPSVMLFAAFVVFGLPLINGWNYGRICGKGKYYILALFTILGAWSGAYYNYYNNHYLDSLAGLGGELAAYFTCAWLMAMIAVFVPFLLIRLLAPLITAPVFWRRLAHFFLAVALAGSLYGCVMGDLYLARERVDLSYPNLPQSFNGMKIALLADTHIGPFYRLDDLREQLADAKRERADYVIIAGDLIDDVRVLPGLQQLLNEEAGHFRHGIDFVWGNHEYYRNKSHIEQYLRDSKLRVLVNEHYELKWGNDGIYIAGVDFPFGHGEEKQAQIREFTEQATAGIPEGKFIILIAHHPDFIGEAFWRGIDLTVAGHSHGGQIGINGHSLMPIYEYNRGLFHEGADYGYVSRGTGHWWPFRLGCSREITYLTLHRA